MTVSSTLRKAGPFNGNGVTTAFPFAFKVFAKTDIQVVKTSAAGVQTTLVLDSDYSVALNADQDNSPGGTVTYPMVGTPLSAGEKLDAVGSLTYDQGTDITNLGRFLPQVHENVFDRIVMLAQQLLEKFTRAIVAPVGDTASMILPTAGLRALKAVIFDASGNVTVSADNYIDQVANVTAQANIATTQAAAAATSRAQMLYIVQGSFAPGAPPTHRDDGSAIRTGDYASFTDNLFRRYNGVTWVASDINTANFAAPGGASLVGFALSATGAAARTVGSREQDLVFATDFAGVDPTGATDSTAGVQAALTYIALVGGGSLYFPPGTYVVNGTLTYTGSNLRIFGAGASSLIKKSVAATTSRLLAFSAGSRSNIEIDHLSFSSDRTVANTDAGFIDGNFNSPSFDGVSIHHCHFNFPNDGICPVFFAIGDAATTYRHLKIVENIFDGVKYAAIAVTNHIGDAVSRIFDVLVTRNSFKDCAGFCGTFSGGMSSVSVDDNDYSGSNGYAVEFVGGVLGGGITNNRFSGSYSTSMISTSGVAPFAQSDIDISGNRTIGTVTGQVVVQSATVRFKNNKFLLTDSVYFSGVNLGCSGTFSGNWVSSWTTFNGAVIYDDSSNYVGTKPPRNVRDFKLSALSGGATASTAAVTLPGSTSWVPGSVRVRVCECAAGGSTGGYVESIFAFRYLNGFNAVQISRTDIVTAATISLSVAYSTLGVTVTATSTVANMQHVWYVEPITHTGYNDATVVISP